MALRDKNDMLEDRADTVHDVLHFLSTLLCATPVDGEVVLGEKDVNGLTVLLLECADTLKPMK